MNRFQKIITISFFVLIPVLSNAWGLLGHRIVGQIADSYLTTKTKTEIQKILGFESVAMASNWADFIKSDTNYKYLSPWHYADLPGGLSEDSVLAYFKADTIVDAYTRINFITLELTKNKLLPTPTKQFYLRLLIHIIGDIHQPLHVGRVEDKGGNSIRLRWFNENVNLHQVWDSKLIDFQQLCYTEYAAAINYTTLAQRNAWQKQTLAQWICDTYNLTEKVYADVQPDQKLDYSYNFKFLAPMNDQLLKAGVHLAGVLNEIFR